MLARVIQTPPSSNAPLRLRIVSTGRTLTFDASEWTSALSSTPRTDQYLEVEQVGGSLRLSVRGDGARPYLTDARPAERATARSQAATGSRQAPLE